MFTGIVQELGRIEALDAAEAGARIRVATTLADDARAGDSIAVEGCCLTAAALGDGWFEADVMNQTLALTTLGGLEPGAEVNLEAALRAGEPLGGHIVQGHVDAVGEVTATAADGFARRLRVAIPDRLERYAVEHGSIAIAGVSLTVAALDGGEVEVSLIPETLERTTLGGLGAGDPVNLELDPIARYVERLLGFVGEERGKGA